MKYKPINNHKNIALSLFTQNIYSLLTWARYKHISATSERWVRVLFSNFNFFTGLLFESAG